MKLKYPADLSVVQIGSPTHVAGVLYAALGYYPATRVFLSELEFKAQLQDFLLGGLAAICLECLDGLHHPSDRDNYAAFILLLSYSRLPASVLPRHRVVFFGEVIKRGRDEIDSFYAECGFRVDALAYGFMHACLGVPVTSENTIYERAYRDQVLFIESHTLPLASLVNRP